MIECSCNQLTDQKIKQQLEGREQKPSVGTIMKELGCNQVCGSCVMNIVRIIREHYGKMENNYESK